MTCQLCGQRVEVYSGGEGTCSYVGLEAEENARLREALSAVWNEGVCAGELKDKVRDALWPKGEK